MFKLIKGYPWYMVSENGEVLSVTRGVLLKPHLCNNGYYSIGLIGEDGVRKEHSVHRLVAEAFCEKPEGYDDTWEVNHKNHIKTDNNYHNLEWVTHRDNLL